MFDPSHKPRIIGVPPGADFPQVLYESILERTQHLAPEEIAQVQIMVATRRMQRRLVQLFQDGPASLLPRIEVVTSVSHLMPGANLPAPISTLRRSLELKELVARLVALDDTLSNGMVVDLADSLAKLLDEMQSEGVPLDALDQINTDVTSGHWEKSLRFLKAIRNYAEALSDGVADVEERHRISVQMLCKLWASKPPETPVIVAGSTGSRDTTRLLMNAVARLPQGAVVLPGFDFDLNDELWSALSEGRDAEDHPQYRFAALLSFLGLKKADVEQWGSPPNEQRNRLISLSLRPASVTDQWLSEGPGLGDLVQATKGYSLIEAAQPRDEALAIAVALRHAIEQGKSVALIAPDATLARRVTAALGRWNIIPDDSGGIPLSLTAVGRFLRHVAALVAHPIAPVDLIATLKHPLTRKEEDRGPTQRIAQEFELFLRRRGITEVSQPVLERFASDRSDEVRAWVDWLGSLLELAALPVDHTILASIERHVALAEAFCGSKDGLWSGSDGKEALNVITDFRREANFAGNVTFHEYFQLFERALSAESDREKKGVHPDVMIWGTLEARVQGADVVVLGGLNEGVWPEQPSPDPWLNRQMRRDIGLLLPERQIGLAAHDFQQAAGAHEVIFSRAKRSEDSETVPSRWLNRLTNLLDGLPETQGRVALNAMRKRGYLYVAAANLLDQPKSRTEPAHRPAPAPPAIVLPSEYAVTDIQRLIRDPYAIYARKILRLRPLDPLTPVPDARIKGTVLHEILEHFFAVDADFSDKTAALDRLRQHAWQALDARVPWPATRLQWWGQLASIADGLIEDEMVRRADTVQLGREIPGLFKVPGTRFQIKGKADRIDRTSDGLVIYDYKTGKPPSDKSVEYYDRQIVIEGVMAEAGAFRDIPPETVAQVIHLDVGRTPEAKETKLEGQNELVTVQGHLVHLLTSFEHEGVGFISRRAMEAIRYAGDYDHLARFGEWDASRDATPESVK